MIDLHHRQFGRCEQPQQGRDGKITKVFVVDRVVLQVVEQLAQIRDLDHDQPVRLQDRRTTSQKIACVVDVG